jgi:hypothetical protein
VCGETLHYEGFLLTPRDSARPDRLASPSMTAVQSRRGG